MKSSALDWFDQSLCDVDERAHGYPVAGAAVAVAVAPRDERIAVGPGQRGPDERGDHDAGGGEADTALRDRARPAAATAREPRRRLRPSGCGAHEHEDRAAPARYDDRVAHAVAVGAERGREDEQGE